MSSDVVIHLKTDLIIASKCISTFGKNLMIIGLGMAFDRGLWGH